MISRNTIHIAKLASRVQTSNANRNGLRNLGFTSVSDILPSSLSLESSRSRTDVKRRNMDGESSASRAKSICGSSTGGSFRIQRSSISCPTPSLSECPSSQQPSRRTRNWVPTRDGITSVRTRRIINGEARARASEHGNFNDLTLPESPIMVPQLPKAKIPANDMAPSSSQQLPVELLSIFDSSNGQPGSSSENVCSRQIAHTEGSIPCPFLGFSIDGDGVQRFNMNGIAEVLMALERIEQDEEPKYEQLLTRETNLFIGGLRFRDQHSDMRLDIDNMSYEELLALEEKIGNVTTALTEEALEKCLKSSFYIPPLDTSSVACGDDVKCSICQEEYVEGDEVGKLGCEHGYHVVCIHHWLRQKIRCPICKVEGAPS